MLIKFVICSTEPPILCFVMSPALYIYHWQWLSRVLSHPHLAALEPHRLELKSLRCSQRWLLPNAVWWWLLPCASPLKGNWWSCSIPKNMLGSSFLPKIFPGHACASKCSGLMASHQCCSEASFLSPQALVPGQWSLRMVPHLQFAFLLFQIYVLESLNLSGYITACSHDTGRWAWDLKEVVYDMKMPGAFILGKM